MKLGINIDFFANSVGIKSASEIVANAGFKYLDYTPPVLEDNWEEIMKSALKTFNEYGLVVHQTHVPFNRYGQYGNKFKLCVDRCMEATAFMGAKYSAVHGDEFDFEKMIYSDEAVFEYNHDFFEPYVKFAGDNGFKLAFETVFEEHPVNRRYTSAPEELMKLILSFKSENAVCCWDFGHAYVSFPEMVIDWIIKFGSLIQCTHVHDNTGMDSHQLPMTGDMNWDKIMKAFKDIGYDGVFSIEYAHGSIPEELLPNFLKLTYNVSKYLCNK